MNHGGSWSTLMVDCHGGSGGWIMVDHGLLSWWIWWMHHGGLWSTLMVDSHGESGGWIMMDHGLLSWWIWLMNHDGSWSTHMVDSHGGSGRWIMMDHGLLSWWICWMNHGGSCGSWWIWHPRDHLLEMFSPQNNRPTKGGFSWKLTLTRTFEFWPYLTGSNFRRGYLYPFTLDLISLPGPFDDFRTFTYIHIYTLKPGVFVKLDATKLLLLIFSTKYDILSLH